MPARIPGHQPVTMGLMAARSDRYITLLAELDPGG